MTRDEFGNVPLNAQATINEVIARYGAWKVLFASLAGVFAGNRARRIPDANDLPDYLRKDVGLPPGKDPPVLW
jgi:hypothetical protein